MSLKMKLKDQYALSSIMEDFYKISSNDYTIEKEPNFLTISAPEGVSVAEGYKIVVDSDGLFAYLSLYPPINSNVSLTLEQLKKTIEDEGIVYGIDSKILEESFMFFSDGVIVEREIIARGVPRVFGKDAVLLWHLSKNGKSELSDIHDIIDILPANNIVLVEEGETIISRRPSTPGFAGFNVRGEKSDSRNGNNKNVTIGKGVCSNALGTFYSAMYKGSVVFRSGTLIVNPTLIFDSDVDLSNGSINFNGTVYIRGNVLPGVEIKATGDVYVDGICRDCNISCDNLYVATGIVISSDGLFNAEGNAVIGYAERAKIYCRGNLIIRRYAVNCEFYSGGFVKALEEEGIISGGIIKAYNLVEAKQLKSKVDMRLAIYMGTKYYLDMYNEVNSGRISKLRALIDKVESIEGYLAKAGATSSVENLASIKEKSEKFLADISVSNDEDALVSPTIIVHGKISSDVSIMFYATKYTVEESTNNIMYKFNNNRSEIIGVSIKNE